jgi:hypothetical protein
MRFTLKYDDEIEKDGLGGHVASTGEMKITYKSLVEKVETEDLGV